MGAQDADQVIFITRELKWIAFCNESQVIVRFWVDSVAQCTSNNLKVISILSSCRSPMDSGGAPHRDA